MDAVLVALSCIKTVLAEGASVMDIAEEWGAGRLDKEPILQQDKPDHKNDQHPQFFGGDGMSAEPSNKDPIEEF